MTSFRLNNGIDVPVIGLGTWQSKPGEVQAAVKTAIEAGCRLIDCAYAYCNEGEVGQALKEVIDQGTVERKDLFIISKIWNTFHHKEDVKPSLKESLTKLGLDYLDLYLIHSPIGFQRGLGLFPTDSDGRVLYDDVSYLETWAAMEECVDDGLVRSIGLSNFNSVQIQDVIDHARIKPAALQVEVQPYFSQEKLVKFCQERNILVNAYSCLGSPARPGAKIDGLSEKPLEDPTIASIADRLGKTPAQVILRWLIQRNIVPVPKSVTPARIQTNLQHSISLEFVDQELQLLSSLLNWQVIDFQLSADDMNTINSLDRNLRLIVPLVERNGVVEVRDKDAPNFPFLIEF